MYNPNSTVVYKNNCNTIHLTIKKILYNHTLTKWEHARALNVRHFLLARALGLKPLRLKPLGRACALDDRVHSIQARREMTTLKSFCRCVQRLLKENMFYPAKN